MYKLKYSYYVTNTRNIYKIVYQSFALGLPNEIVSFNTNTRGHDDNEIA